MAMVAIPPTYKAVGSADPAGLVQLDPHHTGHPGTGPKTINPYLAFGGSIKATAEILAKVMNGEDVAQKVLAAGGTGAYVADLSAGDAPIITVTATGKTPDEALVDRAEGDRCHDRDAADHPGGRGRERTT